MIICKYDTLNCFRTKKFRNGIRVNLIVNTSSFEYFYENSSTVDIVNHYSKNVKQLKLNELEEKVKYLNANGYKRTYTIKELI